MLQKVLTFSTLSLSVFHKYLDIHNKIVFRSAFIIATFLNTLVKHFSKISTRSFRVNFLMKRELFECFL